MNEELKKLEEALGEIRKAMDRRDKDFYKKQLLRDSTDDINVRCLCVPAGAERRSGRYPWKDDDEIIGVVFNMDSNRFNRFVSMINAAGGNFRIEEAIGTRPTVHIDIPSDMLYHLHIDGDGSLGLLKKIIAPKIPGICNIQTFNDKAVQIIFTDGTQTKCVCGKDETFDLYEGIAFCLFKRFLGENGHKVFNNLMRYAMKRLDEQEKQKEHEVEIKAEKKRHEEKKKQQAERRKARKREEQISIYQEAMKRNYEEITSNVPNPYIAPGEPEPPVKPDEKAADDGSELFFDPLSGKTFTSSREKILLAVEALNNRILKNSWASVNEWYEELGLDSSGNLGESMGWNLDHLVDINFVADITANGREEFLIVYVEKPVGYGEGKA